MEPPHLSQDTRTGVLHLEDCIAGCRANASCLSVNYETGLCVMFDSSADLKPGKNNVTLIVLIVVEIAKVEERETFSLPN